MSRPLRIEYEGAYYHVGSRGNEKKNIFFSDRDREQFLHYINKAYDRFAFNLHSYCLMSNHYHLFIETPHGGISKIMHYINSSYVSYINSKYKRAGHLFQSRPTIILVDAEEYALELSRYIHLNPVRAKIVEDPLDYKWSSYKFFVEGHNQPDCLETNMILNYFGKKQKKAQAAYKKFVKDAVKMKIKNPLEDIKAGTILGGEGFVKWVKEKYIKGRMQDRDLPAVRKLNKVSISELQKVVQEHFRGQRRELEKVEAYIIRKYSGLTLREMCAIYGKEISAMSQANRRFTKRIDEDDELRKSITMIDTVIKKMSNV